MQQKGTHSYGSAARSPEQAPRNQFRSLNASLLYCPRCQKATPTRERLLLILPSGILYEYLCAYCGTSTGSKTENPLDSVTIIHP